MATQDTVVQELVVNTLTHKQFKAAQEAGTLSPYELYGTPDTSVRLPVLTPMWFDHITNDVSWLRADTFSWQSGDVYVAAYEHLAEDIDAGNVGADDWKIDTVGDVSVTYILAKDGHKICLPDQEANVGALYESTGVAWYYLLDTENKRFKLPRSKHNKYADTVPVVGNGVAFELTGISGNLSGANALQPVQNQAAIQQNTGITVGLSTDPEKSGIVAQQEQDTDQYKYLYFYVGNFTQDSVEQTAGITTEQLNNKLDVGLGNAAAETKATIVGWSMPDYSAGVSVTLPYTANNKCFVVGYASASNQAMSFMINGEVVSTNGGTNATYYTRTGFYLDAGDVISCTTTGATGVVYPLKGVN